MVRVQTPKTSKKTEEYRNYEDSSRQDKVSQLYSLHHKNQTLDFVYKQKQKILQLEKKQMSCWDAVLLLNELVDDSDPDTEYSQLIHLLQTGESARKAYPDPKYDWFHLTAFIHDLGKVLAHPMIYNEPQWAVVGDTFPLGCKFDDSIVFSEFLKENPDSKIPEYSTKFGVYKEGVGMDNVTLSWGHDEYLYQVCKLNGCTLPPQALNIIRYHSFYPWHTGGAYQYLMNEEDKNTLFWVKEFQKYDLYSKMVEKPNLDLLLPYYQGLMEKYFPPILKW